MKTSIVCRIERELEEEKKELILLEENVEKLRESLVEKVPSPFSAKDIINSLFGAMIMGMTFVFKGGVLTVASNLEMLHVFLIIIVTLVILVAEIYFIAYSRVKDRSQRKFRQFMAKRLLSLYIITLFVTFSLIYILNINNHPILGNVPENILKMVVVTAFPCAVGAAVPSLLKKY